VKCFDDCAAAAASGSGEPADETGETSETSNSILGRAAGDAFLQSAKASIEDLKTLEAMDATPMDDERRRFYADADARLAAMEAARDPAAAAAFAEALSAEESVPDDSGTRDASSLSSPSHISSSSSKSRWLLEALASASGAALETLAGAVKDWVATRTDAAFAVHRHARAVAAFEAEAEARRAEAEEAEGDGARDDTETTELATAEEPSSEEPSPTSGDAEDAAPLPAPLPPAVVAAHARALRDLPVATHARLLRQTRSFADGAAFGALVRYANLRLDAWNEDGGSTVETAASARTRRRRRRCEASWTCSSPRTSPRARRSRGASGRGSRTRGESKTQTATQTADADEAEDGDEDKPERPNAPVESAIARVCSALESADADVAAGLCADATRECGFFARRFALEKLEAFSNVSSLHAKNVIGETKRERVTRYRPIVDPEDEPVTVSALRAACRAFELVDVADGALRACVLLRLADLLERRGGDENLRDALSAAESAVAALDTERDASVSNAVAEWIDAKETLFASGKGKVAHGNLAEAVWDFREATGTTKTNPSELTEGAFVRASSDDLAFAFTPAAVSETAKRTACLHADAVTKAAHLRCVARLNAMGVDATRGIQTLPAELREETSASARDNKWEAAAAKTESALFLSRASARQDRFARSGGPDGGGGAWRTRGVSSHARRREGFTRRESRLGRKRERKRKR
jgi:hypothetical protein